MIYIDHAYIPKRGIVWCHLLSIPHDEDALHAFAQRIGLKREWYQGLSKHPHYDVTRHKRLRAVQCGATEVGMSDLKRLFREERLRVAQAKGRCRI